MMNTTQRLVVVSNRLPFVVRQDGDSKWQVQPGSGGLVSALVPVLRQRGGTWIGWPGTDGPPSSELEQVLAEVGTGCGYTLRPVHLTPHEVHDFYQGFSNEIIWPLFHDLQSVCNFDPAYWRTYKTVNRKYAKAVLAASDGDDFIWVHDYHLMNMAAELRAMGSTSRLGFFLHIPFPSLDLFSKLPWCTQLLDALLQFDLIGFQTARDRRNFVQCVRALVPQVIFEGKGPVLSAAFGNRRIRIGAFPISIDVDTMVQQASEADVTRKAAELHALLPGRTLVLGIDRLDYTKGIPHRLQAFHALLQRREDLRGKISLIQVVVPSRVDIREYDELKTTIEQLVGRINGEFMRPGGWVPVWYIYGHLSPTDLLAYYRAADVALVTPLRDGMNLVAKEYCTSKIDDDGVLVLSEFAGAAAQMGRSALLVNPYDIEGVADAIRAACTMEPIERRARMRSLRQGIRRSDVFWWVDAFLDAAHALDDALPDAVATIAPAREGLRAANDAGDLDDAIALPADASPMRRPRAALLN